MSKNLLHYDIDFDDDEEVEVVQKFKDDDGPNLDRKRYKKKDFRDNRKKKIKQKQSWLDN